MKLSVVILAAGQGKRMKSELPKVLQPLASKPLLQHVVDTVRGLGSGTSPEDAANPTEPVKICVVYGHGGERVQAAFAGQSLDWALQAEQLGTGHALMQAMPKIADDELVLVLCGDVPLTRAGTLLALIAKGGPDAVGLLTVNMRDPSGYGRVVRDAHGKVICIVEHKDATAEQLSISEVNTGLMALPAKRLRSWLTSLCNNNSQGEYYLTDVIAAAVKDGCVVETVFAPAEIDVMGVNDKVQLAEAEAGYRAQRARELMLAGATLADPARIDVRGEVVLGPDVFIDVNVVLVGKVTLGPRVKIGANCMVRDAEIGADTELEPNCVIDRAVIGANCRIGPFARVRPDSVLHDEVHIGNFVEIKKSEIGTGSKANHLTYVGDATIGKDVNVGAGTVTCNYDGNNKWPTVIEDGAFIGSGSMLVAPVRIGAGATIGAGSTITRAAPAGTLTLERSVQTTMPEWQRPAKHDEKTKQALIDKALKKALLD